MDAVGWRALPRRSIKELKENSNKAKVKRIDGEAHARKKREAKHRKEREKYLGTLYENLPKAWRSIERQISVGTSKAYGEACKVLVDLSEAYTLHGRRNAFDKKLKGFMNKHERRRALVRRLVEMGLWSKA